MISRVFTNITRTPRFVKFSFIGPYLFMVFRVGKDVTDVKTFKWHVDNGKLVYVDNRSDHEFKYPEQYEFDWKRTHRELHRSGLHPHISIDDRVFVECIGGDLTIKIEDNTESGVGIYSEPVEYKDQTLDDAEIFFALCGNLILLKIKPFQEKAFRYFVFNDKIKQVQRVDGIAQACVLLPEDQGIIFSNGFYLQTGVLKLFESERTDMMFERLVNSSNGEGLSICILQPYGWRLCVDVLQSDFPGSGEPDLVSWVFPILRTGNWFISRHITNPRNIIRSRSGKLPMLWQGWRKPRKKIRSSTRLATGMWCGAWPNARIS